jgi:hypothetical protein
VDALLLGAKNGLIVGMKLSIAQNAAVVANLKLISQFLGKSGTS